MPFLEKLTKEWDDYPPIRVMVGAKIGLKPKVGREKAKESNFLELLSMFPGGDIKPSVN